MVGTLEDLLQLLGQSFAVQLVHAIAGARRWMEAAPVRQWPFAQAAAFSISSRVAAHDRDVQWRITRHESFESLGQSHTHTVRIDEAPAGWRVSLLVLLLVYCRQDQHCVY
jgi:hypothetical protein